MSEARTRLLELAWELSSARPGARTDDDLLVLFELYDALPESEQLDAAVVCGVLQDRAWNTRIDTLLKHVEIYDRFRSRHGVVQGPLTQLAEGRATRPAGGWNDSPDVRATCNDYIILSCIELSGISAYRSLAYHNIPNAVDQVNREARDAPFGIRHETQPTQRSIARIGRLNTPHVIDHEIICSHFFCAVGRSLTKIEINHLPGANGTLQLAGVDVILSQEVDVSEIKNLSLVPAYGSTTANFGFSSFDGVRYQASYWVNFYPQSVDRAVEILRPYLDESFAATRWDGEMTIVKHAYDLLNRRNTRQTVPRNFLADIQQVIECPSHPLYRKIDPLLTIDALAAISLDTATNFEILAFFETELRQFEQRRRQNNIRDCWSGVSVYTLIQFARRLSQDQDEVLRIRFTGLIGELLVSILETDGSRESTDWIVKFHICCRWRFGNKGDVPRAVKEYLIRRVSQFQSEEGVALVKGGSPVNWNIEVFFPTVFAMLMESELPEGEETWLFELCAKFESALVSKGKCGFLMHGFVDTQRGEPSLPRLILIRFLFWAAFVKLCGKHDIDRCHRSILTAWAAFLDLEKYLFFLDKWPLIRGRSDPDLQIEEQSGKDYDFDTELPLYPRDIELLLMSGLLSFAEQLRNDAAKSAHVLFLSISLPQVHATPKSYISGDGRRKAALDSWVQCHGGTDELARQWVSFLVALVDGLAQIDLDEFQNHAGEWVGDFASYQAVVKCLDSVVGVMPALLMLEDGSMATRFNTLFPPFQEIFSQQDKVLRLWADMRSDILKKAIAHFEILSDKPAKSLDDLLLAAPSISVWRKIVSPIRWFRLKDILADASRIQGLEPKLCSGAPWREELQKLRDRADADWRCLFNFNGSTMQSGYIATVLLTTLSWHRKLRHPIRYWRIRRSLSRIVLLEQDPLSLTNHLDHFSKQVARTAEGLTEWLAESYRQLAQDQSETAETIDKRLNDGFPLDDSDLLSVAVATLERRFEYVLGENPQAKYRGELAKTTNNICRLVLARSFTDIPRDMKWRAMNLSRIALSVMKSPPVNLDWQDSFGRHLYQWLSEPSQGALSNIFESEPSLGAVSNIFDRHQIVARSLTPVNDESSQRVISNIFEWHPVQQTSTFAKQLGGNVAWINGITYDIVKAKLHPGEALLLPYFGCEGFLTLDYRGIDASGKSFGTPGTHQAGMGKLSDWSKLVSQFTKYAYSQHPDSSFSSYWESLCRCGSIVRVLADCLATFATTATDTTGSFPNHVPAIKRVTVIWPTELASLPMEALLQECWNQRGWGAAPVIERGVSLVHWRQNSKDVDTRKPWGYIDSNDVSIRGYVGETLPKLLRMEPSQTQHHTTPLRLLLGLADARNALLICHAEYDAEDPRMSRFSLHDKNGEHKLPAWAIAAANLNCKWIGLASCESVKSGEATNSLNAIGIGQTLVSAGAEAVIGGLWNLPTDAALLFWHYVVEQMNAGQVVQDEGVDWPALVRHAQQRLKTCPSNDAQKFFENLDVPNLEEIKERLIMLGNTPFSNPFYWAGFCCLTG